MNRSDFQNLARQRIKQAKCLLDAGHYPGVYYLAGYAVECALKACIAKGTRRYDFPPDPSHVQKRVYIHDLKKLMDTAELSNSLNQEIEENCYLEAHWLVVKDWSEQSRYVSTTELQAQAMITAICDHQHGIMTWLQRHW